MERVVKENIVYKGFEVVGNKFFLRYWKKVNSFGYLGSKVGVWIIVRFEGVIGKIIDFGFYFKEMVN